MSKNTGLQSQSARDSSLGIGGLRDWNTITEDVDLSGAEGAYKYHKVTLPGTGETLTITLPGQQEMKDVEFVFLVTGGTDGDVVIQDRNDAFLTARNYEVTMTAVGDEVHVKGNGLCCISSVESVT